LALVHPREQPRIVPAPVEKRKRADPVLPFCETTKSLALPLYTVPVGAPGTATVSACLAPLPLWSVVVFVPLFDVHHGVVGPADRPHPFTRFESVVASPRSGMGPVAQPVFKTGEVV
jgi:hypothetical protein